MKLGTVFMGKYRQEVLADSTGIADNNRVFPQAKSQFQQVYLELSRSKTRYSKISTFKSSHK